MQIIKLPELTKHFDNYRQSSYQNVFPHFTTELISVILLIMFSYKRFVFSDIDFMVTPDATFYHTLTSRDSDPNLVCETAQTPSVPMSPTVRPRNKTHSRHSSNEMNLSDNPRLVQKNYLLSFQCRDFMELFFAT